VTLLLYIEYSSKLTREEKLLIDESVLANRSAITNSIKKYKVIFISTTFGFLLFYRMDNFNKTELIQFDQSKVVEVRNLDQHYNNVLQMRSGQLTDLTKFLLKIVFIWSIGNNSTNSFSPGFGKSGFGRFDTVAPNPRITVKLDQNLNNLNNRPNNPGKKSPNYQHNIEFNNDFIGKISDNQLNHILSKHGHEWRVTDVDLKATAQANKQLVEGQPRQLRTRINSENRLKLRSNLEKMASSPTLEYYPNYNINGGKGRAYLCPETNLFFGIDSNNIIRKAYIASEKLIEQLRRFNETSPQK
jgi:hypothetical protein